MTHRAMSRCCTMKLSFPFRVAIQYMMSRRTLEREREREMFYLTTHSTHFIYGYMASDIWLRTILIVRQETRCRHIGYSYRLTARVLLYAPFHRQDSTCHGLCYTIRGALAGTRNTKSRSFRSPNTYSTDNILQYSVTSIPSTELFPSHPSLTHSNGKVK